MDKPNDSSYYDNIKLKHYETQCTLYTDHINSCVVFARDCIRGSFLLNGASVTAIIAFHNAPIFYMSIIFFAMGAFFSVVTSVIAYYYQYRIAESWKYVVTQKHYIFNCEKKTWIASIVFLFLSLLFFSFGLYSAYNTLKITPV